MPEQLAAAAANALSLEALARQATERSAAEERCGSRRKEVERIKNCRTEVEQTEARIAGLRSKVTGAREAVKTAQGLQSQSTDALVSARKEEARADEADPSSAETNAQLRLTLAAGLCTLHSNGSITFWQPASSSMLLRQRSSICNSNRCAPTIHLQGLPRPRTRKGGQRGATTIRPLGAGSGDPGLRETGPICAGCRRSQGRVTGASA